MERNEALMEKDRESVEVEEPAYYDSLDDTLPEYEEPIDFCLSNEEYW